VIAALDIMGCAPRVDLGREVAFLGSAKAYPERPARVEQIETHFPGCF
jgi:hypothetical protein